jgi:oligoribonuclease NrnB/cAMP/cGMP phosphodiesterase (DHH superfamily)
MPQYNKLPLFAKQTEVHYHKNCKDGFMAAYLFHRFECYAMMTRNVIYTAVQYGDEPPALHADTDTLIIVDFSYTVEQTEQYKAQVTNLIFMDHHLTAAENHGGYCFCEEPNGKGIFTKIIKEQRSGAGLMMEFLDSVGYEIPEPLVLAALAVEDRDLWRFELEDSKYWTQVLSNTPMTFQDWDDLFHNSETIRLALEKAKVQVEQYEFMVSNYAKLAITIENSRGSMALVNCASNFASSVGEALSKTHAFACMFVVVPKTKIVICSLRSDSKTGMDVSVLAKKLGGGGHKTAAGCSFDISDSEKMAKLMDGTLFD